MNFVFNYDDLKWVAPRHAEALWASWLPMCQEIAKAIAPQYQSTILKSGADEIRFTAYVLGPHSRFWPRFRDTLKEFPRLQHAYWVKSVSPWFEHNSMPYIQIRGRTVFWPGLDKLAETYRELDKLNS